MTQSPSHVHPIQQDLWDQVVKSHGYPTGYEGKRLDDGFNRPFHHIIAINHAVMELAKADERCAELEMVMRGDPTYERCKFQLMPSAYVTVQSGARRDLRIVEVSNLVYSQDITFVSTPKKA